MIIGWRMDGSVARRDTWDTEVAGGPRRRAASHEVEKDARQDGAESIDLTARETVIGRGEKSEEFN